MPQIAIAEDGPWSAYIRTLEGAYADRTLENCAGVWRLFGPWCAARGESSLPASAATVAAYVEAMFGRIAANSIRTRLAEIRRVHFAAGFEDPTRTRAVMLAVRRGRRTYPSAIRQAAGLNAPLRDELLAACSDDLLGLRDRLMILMGYETLARSIELVAFRVEDLTRLPGGGASLLVRRAKNDPSALGQLGYISPGTLALLDAWLERSGVSEGPILRPFDWGVLQDRAIDKQVVSHRIRILARRAGLAEPAVRRLTSHSLRVGAAQDLAGSGRTLLEIMRAGRWRFIESVMDYTRHAPVNVWAPGDGDAYALHRDVQARIRRHVRRTLNNTPLSGAAPPHGAA